MKRVEQWKVGNRVKYTGGWQPALKDGEITEVRPDNWFVVKFGDKVRTCHLIHLRRVR